MGIFWALVSVVLVSGAQLLLRAAMLSLPPVADVTALFWHLIQLRPGTGSLFLGLCGYAASMACWFFCPQTHSTGKSLCAAEPELHHRLGCRTVMAE